MKKLIKCPECGKGLITQKVVPKYYTKVKGKTCVVFNAQIATCDKCDFVGVSAKELKRWQEANYDE
jgi:hypothetical protein